MKNLLPQVFALLLLAPSVALAAPFAVCDPDPAAAAYDIEIDGEVVETAAPLRYDLKDVDPGAHQIRARAKNVRGPSDWTPFLTLPPVCGVPTGLRLSED